VFLIRVIMSLIKYIERLRRMDLLISMMATGTPEEFAEKMGMKRSTLFESLQEMRAIGVDIKYSFIRQSYYYADNRRIKIRLENIVPEKTDSEKISFSCKG
jgi:biotin operon repressor